MPYISVEHQTQLAARYRAALVITVGFCVSILLFMLVARLLRPQEMTPGSEQWQYPIYAGVLVLGLVVVVLRRLMLAPMLMGEAVRQGVGAVLNRLTLISITCGIAAETVALLGLVAYLLTGQYDYSWRLGVVGLFLVIYSFPRRFEWERVVAESEK